MARRKKWKTFFKQYVFFVGFLNGIWLSIGINPGQTIVKWFAKIFLTIDPNLIYSIWFNLFFKLLPILIFIYILYKTYEIGKDLGLISVFFAFLSGLIIFSSLFYAIILLILSIIFAYKGVYKKR